MTRSESERPAGRRLRVLNVIAGAFLGGHVISTRTISHALARRGHRVEVAGGYGPLTETFEERGIPFRLVHDPSRDAQVYVGTDSWKTVRDLRRIIRGGGFDILHAYDLSALVHLRLACPSSVPPTLITVCGGPGPSRNIPPAARLLVFSEELRDLFVRRYEWPESRVVVLPNRVETRGLAGRKLDPELRSRYGLTGDRDRILIVCRLKGEKINAVRAMLDALPGVVPGHPRTQLVVIGDGPGLKELIERGEELNRLLGEETVLFLGAVVDARSLLPAAEVVAGVGRSLFEAMALGKPSLVVGNHGWAGSVREDSVAQLARFNFSGRNALEQEPRESLVEELRRILRDRAYRDELSVFADRYAREQLDVDVGAERLESIYRGLMGDPPRVSRARVLRRAGGTAAWYLVQGIRRRLRPR